MHAARAPYACVCTRQRRQERDARAYLAAARHAVRPDGGSDPLRALTRWSVLLGRSLRILRGLA